MEVQNAGYGRLVALPLHTAMLFLADWCAQAACALQAAKKRRQCYCFWTPRRVGILIEDDKWILSCLMNVTIIARKCIRDTTRYPLNFPKPFPSCQMVIQSMAIYISKIDGYFLSKFGLAILRGICLGSLLINEFYGFLQFEEITMYVVLISFEVPNSK